MIDPVIKYETLREYVPPGHTETRNVALLAGQRTDGAISVVRGRLGPGGEAKPHLHRLSAQFVHIISGTARLTTQTGVAELSAGDSAYFPIGMAHRVEVVGDHPVELINVYCPALSATDIIEVDAFAQRDNG